MIFFLFVLFKFDLRIIKICFVIWLICDRYIMIVKLNSVFGNLDVYLNV